MGLQPSASRTALLLACPRPFEAETEIEPDPPREPARYGSAFHQVIAACARAGKLLEGDKYTRTVDAAVVKYDVAPARSELAAHVKSSFKVLWSWLKREKLEVKEIETAYGVRPNADGTWASRPIPPHDEDHHYNVDPDVMPGTVDLVAVSPARVRQVVIDHKTGSGDTEAFAKAADVPQMRTLGLTPSGSPHVEVGIFHADRRGLPMLYVEEFEPADQRGHARALNGALNMIGLGFMRNGPQCPRCPARIDCPVYRADLLAETTAQLVASANSLADEPVDPKRMIVAPVNGSSLETRAGALYDLLKRFRALDKAGTEELKRLVREGRVIETREGPLMLKKQVYENLSKKSVIDALGSVAGERQLKKLREKGAIREVEREMLVPDKDGR